VSINNPHRLTPCIGRCSHNVGGDICRGCGRSVEQVRDWNTYTEEQKLAIMRRLEELNPCTS
jgi:predicted Fe-S protein YdhL (DUF1289 family)